VGCEGFCGLVALLSILVGTCNPIRGLSEVTANRLTQAPLHFRALSVSCGLENFGFNLWDYSRSRTETCHLPFALSTLRVPQFVGLSLLLRTGKRDLQSRVLRTFFLKAAQSEGFLTEQQNTNSSGFSRGMCHRPSSIFLSLPISSCLLLSLPFIT
jgi:hypothetical protein